MPLDRQIVTLPLSFGIDTKTDAKQIPYGKLLELENGVFTSPKLLQKRNGYKALPTRVDSSSGYRGIKSANALTGYKNELVMVGRDTYDASRSKLYSYSNGSESWVEKSDYTPCSMSSKSVSKSSNIKYCCDSAVLSNQTEVYAWEESGNVYYSVIDTESKQSIVSNGIVSSNAYYPRVITFAGGLAVYYIDSGSNQIYVRSIILSSNASLGTPTAITSASPGTDNTLSSSSSNRCYDVCVVENGVFVVFNTATSKINVRKYAAGVPYSLSAQQLISPANQPIQLSVCYNKTDNEVAILFSDLTAASRVLASKAASSLLDAFPTPQVIQTAPAGETVKSIGVVAIPQKSSAERYSVWTTTSQTLTNIRYTTKITNTDLVSVSTSGSFLGFAIACKPWALNGRAFCAMVFVSYTTGSPSGLQNQYIVASDNLASLDVVSRFFYTTASGVPVSSGGPLTMLASSWVDSSSNVSFCVLQSSMLQTSVGDVQSVAGVSSVNISFAGAPLVDNTSQIGGTLVLGGGLLSIYDGVTVTESGFLVWPDEVTGVLSSGGSLSAGDYQWVVTYEWTDNLGIIHRSAPSIPVKFTVTSGQKITVNVTNLTLTKKQVESPVRIVLYRTTANGSVFYRASSLTTPTLNSTTSFYSSVVDSLSDADLSSRPFLYTTGGIVENIPPGSVRSLSIHRGRLFGIDSMYSNKIWYSRQISSDAPVEFSEFFYLDVDERAGAITALASVDDKLIVFKETQIMMVAGQGPDATGNQNDFSDSILVTSDCGCIDSRSIVVVPDGIMFQSAKGIYFLDRSLQVKYIGAAVEKYNLETVESAQLIPTANQVRFVLGSGVALVYDYFVGQWSVFTNHAGVDTVVWNDHFCWLRSDGVVFEEDPSRFDDNGSFVQLMFKTGWITFGTDAGAYILLNAERNPTAMNSFQRTRRILLLGEYRSPHTLRVELAHDYSPVPTQTVDITPPSDEVYGDHADGTYGDGTPYGSDWQLYQWRVDCIKQKCQSIQITVSDQQVGNDLGDCVRFSAVSAQIGLKPGTTRVPMSHVAG